MITLALLGCCRSAPAQEAGVSLDQRLILACYRLQVPEVAECLRKGADVNGTFGNPTDGANPFDDPLTDGLGPIGFREWTPLMALASSSSEVPAEDATYASTQTLVAMLMRRRSETEVRDLLNYLAREVEARGRANAELLADREAAAVAICHLLYSHNCALERADDNGATAVYMASKRKRTGLLRQLLKYGANPNVKVRRYIDGPSDLTPLHRASGFPEAAELLLDYGADPEARDSDGRTPGDEIREEGYSYLKTPKGWRVQKIE